MKSIPRSSTARGRVHVYTGDGKGKTTAAIGLAVRACGAGLRVFVGQFFKAGESSEISLLRERLPEIETAAFGDGRFIRGRPSAVAVAQARKGLASLREAASSGDYDLVVADEANGAVKAGLFPVEELLDLIACRQSHVELVFTGRDAHPKLLAEADLVSDIRAVKHYFSGGATPRRGIEV